MSASEGSTEGSQQRRRLSGIDGVFNGAETRQRGVLAIAVYLMPIALWFAAVALATSPAFAQQAVRRAGEVRDAKADAQRQRTLSRLLLGTTRNLSNVTVDGGDHEIAIHTGKLGVESADFRSLEQLSAGEVQVITLAAASKFSTDRALAFSGTALKESNAASPGGVYSLWLKRVEDGWHLVFNREADVWGTQRDPAMDVAEIGLSYTESEDPASELTPKLTLSGDTGQLALNWGRHRWTAAFELEAP